MASANKEAKTGTAEKHKTETETKTETKSDAPAKTESPAAKDTSKSAGGETAAADSETAAAPANYSRGEGQKPVTAAYRENWNAIFAKKTKTKRKNVIRLAQVANRPGGVKRWRE